jgi:glycosyltransferase 2 family protein
VLGLRNVRRFFAARRTQQALTALSIGVAVAIPLLTLPGLPHFTLWPALIGLLPWTVGKYVLCPLRWHALTESGRPRRWHLAVYAESELFGLLTPGHFGADVWRMRRLCRAGMPRLSAIAEISLDRFVGAIGLTVFVACAATTLPLRMVLIGLGGSGVTLLAALVLRRVRPDWMPQRRLPAPHRVANGLVLSAAYQASIVGLLLGTLLSTGYSVSPIGVVGAVGASQLAGAIPGPQGASPKDGALVLALTHLGVPWGAALGAVALKALLAWAPALVIGGGCLLLARLRSRDKGSGGGSGLGAGSGSGGGSSGGSGLGSASGSGFGLGAGAVLAGP